MSLETLQVDITLSDSVAIDTADSVSLKELAKKLLDHDITTKSHTRKGVEGRKDGGLVVGLTIAGLAVSAVGTLASVISTWNSRKPKYSVTISRGDTTVSASNLSGQQLRELTSQIKAEKAGSVIDIEITHA